MIRPVVSSEEMTKQLKEAGWKETISGWWKHNNKEEFGFGVYSTTAAYHLYIDYKKSIKEN